MFYLHVEILQHGYLGLKTAFYKRCPYRFTDIPSPVGMSVVCWEIYKINNAIFSLFINNFSPDFQNFDFFYQFIILLIHYDSLHNKICLLILISNMWSIFSCFNYIYELYALWIMEYIFLLYYRYLFSLYYS